MACGCNAPVPVQNVVQQQVNNTECEYTTEQIIVWKDLYHCISDVYFNFNLTSKQYNKDIGVLYSVTNYNNNPCYFKTQLDRIKQTILLIINADIC